MNVSGSSFDSDLTKWWSVAEMRRELQCTICNSENFNNWYVCVRKHSLVNLHIGYVSRPRQSWLLAMAIAKFLVIPEDYDGPFFQFQGPIQQIIPGQSFHEWQIPRTPKNPGVRIVRDTTENRLLPRFQQAAFAIAYGKCTRFIFIKFITVYIFRK